MKPDTLNIIGLSLNITGTVILAFSLSAYINAIILAIQAHELEILSIQHPNRPRLKVTGTDWHLKKGKRKAIWFSLVGVFLVIGGFVFQIISYWV